MRGEALSRAAIGAAAVGAAVASYTRAIRPWHLRRGATDRGVQEPLPGDEIMPHPELEATHAVTIQFGR